MKSISAELQAHYESGTATIATCWKVTRQDSTVFGFTDFDRPIVFSGVTYLASSGYTRSAIQSNSALSVDNLELIGVLADVSIQDTDIFAGLWDYAQVEIFTVNRADLTMGALKELKGRLGEVRSGKVMFIAELRGLTQQLQQNAGRLITMSCDADLGDARCKVNLAPLTVTGNVSTAQANKRIFTDGSLIGPDGNFDAGTINWLTGNNAGLPAVVKTFVYTAGPIVTLQVPMPYSIVPGDTYTMTPGCLKRFTEDCIGKFNNGVNFRGFPHVPGLDLVLSGHEN